MTAEVNHPGPHDLTAALEKLRAILSGAQAQVGIALEEAARLPAQPQRGVPCPLCGIIRPTDAALEEHQANVHGLTLEAAS